MEDLFGYSEERAKEIIHRILYPKVPYKPIAKDYDNPKYLDPETCKNCGGACCKRIPCAYSPDDFEEMSYEYLSQRLKKGDLSIDLIDREQVFKDTDCYYIRPRIVGNPVIDARYSAVRGPCIHLTEEGCDLSYEERPTGGRLLIPEPKKGVPCHADYPIDICWKEWLPFKELLAMFVRPDFSD